MWRRDLEGIEEEQFGGGGRKNIFCEHPNQKKGLDWDLSQTPKEWT